MKMELSPEEIADLEESKGQMVKHPARVCQFACKHECTLMGHAYEAIRFLNQCLEAGIVRSAVEETPQYRDLNIEIAKMQFLLLQRIPRK